MRWYKIRALMLRDFIIFKRSKWHLLECFYFPLTTVIIWGLFAIFTRDSSAETGLMVLGVNVFWSFSYLAQTNVNIQMNEDTSSGSMKQVLCSGISEFEYLFSRLISSTVISGVIMVIMIYVSILFGLQVFMTESVSVMLLSVITLLGSLSLAILVAALIILLGREYNFLAWTILQLFIMLSAPFFPLEILPVAVQYISKVMPFTNIFLGIRTLVGTGSIPQAVFVNSFIIVLAYLAVSVPIYYFAFKRAKRNGLLAKMT